MCLRTNRLMCLGAGAGKPGHVWNMVQTPRSVEKVPLFQSHENISANFPLQFCAKICTNGNKGNATWQEGKYCFKIMIWK